MMFELQRFVFRLEVKLNVNNSVRADDQGQAGAENEQPPVVSTVMMLSFWTDSPCQTV